MERDFGFLVLGLTLIAGSSILIILKLRRYKPANFFYPGYYTSYTTLLLAFVSGLWLIASFFDWI